MFEVVFVLGGPGSGKGTQCSLLTSKFSQWTHLSAGDLLRAERKSGSELAGVINSYIDEGKIVPSEVTVKLLHSAMIKIKDESDDGDDGKKTKFLIDGFPRSEENMNVWEEQLTGLAKVKFVLFMDCSEDVMTTRLLERGQTSGRTDDNIAVIKKRFETFRMESMPIVEKYEQDNTLRKIQSDRPVDEIHQEISAMFL